MVGATLWRLLWQLFIGVVRQRLWLVGREEQEEQELVYCCPSHPGVGEEELREELVDYLQLK